MATNTQDLKSITVLVVDDDPLLLNVVELMLEMAGYRVLKTTDPVEALDIYQQHQAEIDVVITDQKMPRMDGLTLIKELHKQNPEIKVISMTNDPIKKYEHHVGTFGLAGYFQKPLDFKTLDQMIKSVLNA